MAFETTPAHLPRWSAPRFLVLDSHQVLRTLLRPLLESLGATRTTFVSTPEAFEEVLAESPDADFIIADWDEAAGGGVAFLHRLRHRPATRRASVIFLAHEVTPEMLALRPLYRVAAFLPKPFTAQAVGDAVRAETDARSHPCREALLLERAWRLLEDGSAAKALLVYQWLRSLHPASLSALYGAGAALGAAGEYDAGLTLLDRVVAAAPLFLEGWNRMAAMAEAEGDEVRAGEFSERAAALAPDSAYVLLRAARRAQKRGEMAQAERLLRQALKDSPELWAPAFELTELLLAQDRLYDAARVVDRVKVHHAGRTDLIRLLNELGVALRRGGHLAAAQQTYALALSERPADPSLLCNAAVAHALAGELGRAREFAHRALDVAPNLHTAVRLLRAIEGGTLREMDFDTP